MAETVDPLILEIIARLDRYEADVKGAADVTEREFARVQNAADKTEKNLVKSFDNTRISQQILMRAFKGAGDQYASGAPALTLITTHLGEFAEAAAYGGSKLGKLGEFMSGPWGIAVAVGAQVLLPLIANLFKAGDGVDDLVRKLQEHFEKSEASDRANKLFAQSLEGVEQAARDQEKALEALENRHKTQEQQSVESIQHNLDEARSIRVKTQALLDAARASNQAYNGSLASADPRFAREFQIPQARIDELQKQLDASNKKATDVEAQLTRAVAQRTVQQASRDPAKIINDRYDAQVDAATRAAVASGKVTTALDAEVKAINRARDAELKRLKDTDSAARSHGSHLSNAETGRELSFAQAQAIAEGAGLHVNSAFRSTAHQADLYNDSAVNRPGNPVARPGSSAHEGANGRWALDIQLGPGVTPELLRKVFAAQGVNLSKVFKENGHYHIEGQRNQADVQSERAAQREAEATERAAEQEAKRYETTKDRLELEGKLAELRSGDAAIYSQIADELQSNFDLESQFPKLAGETNDAYRARLKILEDIANANIAAKYADQGSLVPKNLMSDVDKQLNQIGEDWEREQNKLTERQAEQIRTLANLYQDAFRGGTHAIWDDFKNIGLEVVAEVLAKFTLAKIGGGSFNLGSAITTALGAALPGFAGGGSIAIGGRGGVDQNVLSLNGQPMARVSAGEVLSIGNQRLGPSGGATVVQHISVDARNSVNPTDFAQQILAVSGQQAQQAAAQMGQRFIKAVPQRMASYQRDGF